MHVNQGKSMYDFYTQHLVAYGEVLTDMEREGIQVTWPLMSPIGTTHPATVSVCRKR